MRRRIRLTLTALLLVSGCTAGEAGRGYELNEFSIDGPATLHEGLQTLEVANSGGLPHTLVLTDSSGGVVAATDLIQPGETSELEVELKEGRYTFTCRIVAENDEGEIVDHFEQGMSETVGVTE